MTAIDDLRAPNGPNDVPGAEPPAGESALVERLRMADPVAFEELVRAHSSHLLAVARRLLRQDEDARDAVQEAFLLAFRGLSSFAGRCRLSTWLHRIVVNAALMKLRSRQRKPESLIDDLLPEYQPDGHHVEEFDEWRLPASDRILRDEMRAQVRAAIDRLPETYRTVLMLRDIEELDTPEVAEMLGISGNAVKIRLHRARQALRTLLDPVFVQRSPSTVSAHGTRLSDGRLSPRSGHLQAEHQLRQREGHQRQQEERGRHPRP